MIQSIVNSVTGAATGSLAGSGSNEWIKITGSGFLGAIAVQFDGTQETHYKVVGDGEIDTNFLPHAAGLITVTVFDPANDPSPQTHNFTYEAPVVTSISPSSGPLAGKTPVTITGKYLTGATEVKFGDPGQTILTVVNDTTITAESIGPVSAGTVDVSVGVVGTFSPTTPPGAYDEFTYVPPPAVTSLRTTAGLPLTPADDPNAGGTSLIINGTGFLDVTSVKFGDITLTPPEYTVVSDTEITAISPAGSGTADVTVTTKNGTSAIVSADQFRYATIPLTVDVPPDVAARGAYLTMYGTLSEDYTNASGTITSGTNVYLVNTGSGYDYAPLAALGTYGTIPPFLVTSSALSDDAIQLPNVQISSVRVVIGVGAVATVSADSNNQPLPLSTIDVASTAGFATSGVLEIQTKSGAVTTASYSGITATSFTGVSGGTGTLATGEVIRGSALVTTVSSNPMIPKSGATIAVASTAGFAPSGWLTLGTASGNVQVPYSIKTTTSFTIEQITKAITLQSGDAVSPAVLTTVSGTQTISTNGGPFNVASTAGFATTGILTVAIGNSTVQVPYVNTTATSFIIPAISSAITFTSGSTIAGDALPAVPVDGGSVAAPTPESEGNNIYDFFEFTYLADTGTGLLKLTINTSAIDQFGMPLTIDLAGGAVSPIPEVGIQLTRQQVIGSSGDNGLFSQSVAGTAFGELTDDGFGNPTTARIISPEDQLDYNTVQNLTASSAVGTGVPAGTYYYAVTALADGGESNVSQFAKFTLDASGSVKLVWSAVTNPGVTGYNVYRGILDKGSIAWSLVGPDVQDPDYTDTQPTGTQVDRDIVDPLSKYFNTSISSLFGGYDPSNPLEVTATDGSGSPGSAYLTADGIQYTFQGIATTEPGWVLTQTGGTARAVLEFTCTSIASPTGAPAPLIPIGSVFFVYEPFFDTNDPT